MKAITLIKKLKDIDDYGMQAFWDKNYGGSCPCFAGEKTVEGKKIRVQGSCWRSSQHSGQDLYVDSNLPEVAEIAAEIKRALDAQEWYQPYTLVINDIIVSK